jgi:hypothetical protein
MSAGNLPHHPTFRTALMTTEPAIICIQKGNVQFYINSRHIFPQCEATQKGNLNVYVMPTKRITLWRAGQKQP